MRCAILHKETEEPITQSGEILYFKNYASAQRYLSNSVVVPSNYKIWRTPDLESKKNLINYDDAITDICHAIELEKTDDNLLKLVKLLQDVLTKRRKIRYKLKGFNGGALREGQYKNKTTILNTLSGAMENDNDK
jgi:hypothetical protein